MQLCALDRNFPRCLPSPGCFCLVSSAWKPSDRAAGGLAARQQPGWWCKASSIERSRFGCGSEHFGTQRVFSWIYTVAKETFAVRVQQPFPPTLAVSALLDHFVALRQPGLSVSLVSYRGVELRWEDSWGASSIAPPSADLEALCPRDMDYSSSCGIEELTFLLFASLNCMWLHHLVKL